MTAQSLIKVALAAVLTLAAGAVVVAVSHADEAMANCHPGMDC